MALANMVNRWKMRIGSLLPWNAGKIYDEIDALEAKKPDLERLVAFLGTGYWTMFRMMLRTRIDQLEQNGFQYMRDPEKFKLQAADCASRRDEGLKILGMFENSPQDLQIVRERLIQLYEITRSDATSDARPSL